MSATRLGVLSATVTVASVLAVSLPSVAMAAPSSAEGDGWSVDPAAGGYVVTVDLDEPLPIIDDAPTILVDGAEVGYAMESSDGLSLSAFTTDPSVLSADAVEWAWSSGGAKGGAGEAAPVERQTKADRTLQRQLAESSALVAPADLEEDPGALGDFEWTEAEYDFGNSVLPLPNLGGVYGELTGKLYLTDAEGARPTVVLMHGRHGSCTGGTANPLRWPCGATQTNIRSYLGYEGTGRALASHGYNVVSIAVNAVNSNDNQLASDYGAHARGQMVLDTLDLLDQLSSGDAVSYYDQQTQTDVTFDEALEKAVTRTDFPAEDSGISAADLVGDFDLEHVGIMGHSRGGEGVMSAATLNLGLEQPYGIEAVLPLAPVDFGRMTLPDVPMLTILPYCDGDVSNQQGQHMYDDTRYAADDDVQRAAMWVMGTNHNFFNTQWTPGFADYPASSDWPASDTTTSCATVSPTRLTPEQQYQTGVSYMTGYFRYVMGGESEFAELYDGSAKPVTPDTEFADVRVMAAQPNSSREVVASFMTESNLIRTAGTGSAQVCVNATGITIPQSLPLCVTSPNRTSSGAYPHWAQMRFGGNVPANPVTVFNWTDATGSLRVMLPKADRDVSEYEQLTLRAAPYQTVTTGTDFTLTLIDGDGATWSGLASEIDPLVVNEMPGGNATLDKVVLQQLTVPTDEITGIDLTDLREVRFTGATGADGTPAGGVYLSDLVFDTPSLGTTVIEQHTTINTGSVNIDEGRAAGTVEVPVWLNRADTVPVTGYLSVIGSATGRANAGMVPVTFAPGEVCTTVEMPLNGDTAPSTTASSPFVIAVTNTQQSVMGADAFGWLTVREDDGFTNGTTALPEFGEQGDACDELAALGEPGAIDVADELAAGAEFTATASGYRSGESVAFALDSVVLGSAIAESDGSVEFTGTLPADAEFGAAELTATGAGSMFVSNAAVEIVSATVTVELSSDSVVFGEPVTATATVSGPVDGFVRFDLGGTTTLVRIVDGVAVLELPADLAAGEYTLEARYNGTDEIEPSAIVETEFEVTPAPTAVSLELSKATAKQGSKVTATVVVSGATAGTVPTGRVELVRAGKVVEDVRLRVSADGELTITMPVGKKTGTVNVKAVYSGANDYAGSTSDKVALRVTKN